MSFRYKRNKMDRYWSYQKDQWVYVSPGLHNLIDKINQKQLNKPLYKRLYWAIHRALHAKSLGANNRILAVLWDMGIWVGAELEQWIKERYI